MFIMNICIIVFGNMEIIAMSDKSRLNLFRYHMLATNDSGAVIYYSLFSITFSNIFIILLDVYLLFHNSNIILIII
jgi:hypothetical protein